MTRSIFSNWFGLIVMAGCTALLTPVMIHHLGAIDYGVWVLAGSVLDYYGLLDIGMRAAMFRYVGKFRGSNVREEIDRTFSSALFIVILTAVIICFLSVAVAWFLPRVVTLRGSSPQVFGWLLLVLGISVGITFPMRMLATYISAHQRWDLFNAAGIASVITRTVAIIAVLKFGFGLLAVAIATLIVAILSLGQHILFVRVVDPQVRVSGHLVSGKRIRELFGFSLRSLLVSVGDYLRFYSDSAVIAAVLNVALITPFSVATRLIECFKAVIVAAGGPVFGSLTELDGGRREEESRELLLRSTRMLAFLAILGGVLLLVDGRTLLQIWVGPELIKAYPLLAVLAVGYTINLALHPMLLIVIAKGKHGPLGAWTVVEGLVNIGLSILWGKSYGLMGIAMGTVVPMLFIKLVIQPYYSLRAAEMSLWTFVRRGLARPLIVGPLFIAAAGYISIFVKPNLPVFSVAVITQVLVFLPIVWLLGLTRIERQRLREYRERQVGVSVLRCVYRLLGSRDVALEEKRSRYSAPGRNAVCSDSVGREFRFGGSMQELRVSSSKTAAVTGESDRISVIIPTKNRAEDLRCTLNDLMNQTRRPDEILVVDQSPIPCIAPDGNPQCVTYIHAPNVSGAAVARNLAMDRASGDVWVFLDDDVILEPQYIDEIVRAYRPDIAGVSGIITNYSIPPLQRRLFERLFVRGPFHDDRQPIYWRAEELRFKSPVAVRQFGCGLMSFRAIVIQDLRFDPNLTGGSLAEDIDFCARLPRGSQLLIAPNARLIHKRSVVGRASAHWLDSHSQSSSYMRERNWRRGIGDDMSFAWLQVGYTLMSTIGSLKHGSLEPFRAWRRGAKRGRTLGSQRGIFPSAKSVKQSTAQG